MSQLGYPGPMRYGNIVYVSEYFLNDRGIDIPKDWLEDEPLGSGVIKILRLVHWPSREKTKYHDVFYEKYFAKYPQEV